MHWAVQGRGACHRAFRRQPVSNGKNKPEMWRRRATYVELSHFDVRVNTGTTEIVTAYPEDVEPGH